MYWISVQYFKRRLVLVVDCIKIDRVLNLSTRSIFIQLTHLDVVPKLGTTSKYTGIAYLERVPKLGTRSIFIQPIRLNSVYPNWVH